MNLLMDEDGAGGDIILESPEGENQNTFHREDKAGENLS